MATVGTCCICWVSGHDRCCHQHDRHSFLGTYHFCPFFCSFHSGFFIAIVFPYDCTYFRSPMQCLEIFFLILTITLTPFAFLRAACDIASDLVSFHPNSWLLRQWTSRSFFSYNEKSKLALYSVRENHKEFIENDTL